MTTTQDHKTTYKDEEVVIPAGTTVSFDPTTMSVFAMGKIGEKYVRFDMPVNIVDEVKIPCYVKIDSEFRLKGGTVLLEGTKLEVVFNGECMSIRAKGQAWCVSARSAEKLDIGAQRPDAEEIMSWTASGQTTSVLGLTCDGTGYDRLGAPSWALFI